MPISLFDPSSQTKQPMAAGTRATPRCATTRGPSEGLPGLRQAVIDDVIQGLLGVREQGTSSVRELAEREVQALGAEYDASTLRHWILTVHYRSPLVLEPETTASPRQYRDLDESEQRVVYLAATKQRLLTLPEARIIPVQTAPADALAELPDALEHALEDDLDTPGALAAVASFLAAVNALCDAALRKKGKVNASAVATAHAGFLTIGSLLGLGSEEPGPLLERVRDQRARRRQVDVSAVNAAVARRAAARAARDFASADALQADLLEQGITLIDGPQGTTWTFV